MLDKVKDKADDILADAQKKKEEKEKRDLEKEERKVQRSIEKEERKAKRDLEKEERQAQRELDKEKRSAKRELEKEKRALINNKSEAEYKQKQLASKERETFNLQEQLKREKELVDNEKYRLLALDNQGLKVEMILAMKGLFGKIEALEVEMQNLDDELISMRVDISDLDNYTDDLYSRINSIEEQISNLDGEY